MAHLNITSHSRYTNVWDSVFQMIVATTVPILNLLRIRSYLPIVPSMDSGN